LKSVWNSYKGDPSNDGYCDPSGFCWVAPIEPEFDTTRGGFYIHPDGREEGTKGCIGISQSIKNTKHIWEALKKQREKFGPQKLMVRP